jgi:murein DD-endopeptidase MepM/ murein hydrolase activator NlpD
MRRSALLALVLASLASPALAAADAGGAAAPSGPVGNVGGASTPPSGRAPVARLVAPALAGPGAPSIRVTFNGIDEVTARVVVLRLPSNRVVARIPLGSVRVGRSVAVPWRAGALRSGRYVVRVHAHDQWNRQLRRLASASGKALLVVHGVHRPATPPPPPPPPVTSSSGVFPVAGWHTYGDPFGAPRKGYSHQGQDVLGSRGTPIVAPTNGTVTSVGYQASAAGEYVVETAANGYAYFFAHCIRHSTVVSAGQAVAAGASICQLGATGDATGPHLHFEVWTGGWRTGSASKPIDPLPLLKAWDAQG